MRCIRCGNETYTSTTAEAIELGKGVLVIRGIPCQKCEICGEIMYSGDVARRIERLTDEAKQRSQEVAVIGYPQAASA